MSDLWFDRLTTNGNKLTTNGNRFTTTDGDEPTLVATPFALSLSKGNKYASAAPRTCTRALARSAVG